VSLPVAAACFYGIRLQGSFVLFWLVYYITLCVGIGECQQCMHKVYTLLLSIAAPGHLQLVRCVN
jgi:hypothetical protein